MLSTALLLAASMVVGQDQSAAEQLKEFQPFIGHWVFQGVSQEDIPLPDGEAVVKKGVQFVGYNSFRWAIRRNAVVFDWSVRLEGQDAVESTQTIVWVKKDKVLRCLWQHTAGEQGTTDWTFEEYVLVGKIQAIDNRGIESTAKVHFRLKGSDAYVWKITDRSMGGEPLPDSAEYEYVRVR